VEGEGNARQCHAEDIEERAHEWASVNSPFSTGDEAAPAFTARRARRDPPGRQNTVNDKRQEHLSLRGFARLECAGVRSYWRPQFRDRRLRPARLEMRASASYRRRPARYPLPIAIRDSAARVQRSVAPSAARSFPPSASEAARISSPRVMARKGETRRVCAIPSFVEQVADHRRAALCASFGSRSSIPTRRREALRLQRGAEIPVIDGGVHFADEYLRRSSHFGARNDRRLWTSGSSVLFHNARSRASFVRSGLPATASLRPLRIRQRPDEDESVPSLRRARVNTDRNVKFGRQVPRSRGHHSQSVNAISALWPAGAPIYACLRGSQVVTSIASVVRTGVETVARITARSRRCAVF